MSSRWTVPAVAVLVGLVLVVVTVRSLTGSDDQTAGSTTSAPSTSVPPASATSTTRQATGPVDAVCIARRDDLLASASVIAGLAADVGAAETPSDLLRVAEESRVTSDLLLAGMEQLQTEVAATPVPPEQVAGRDQIAAVLGELIFATTAFSHRTVEVLSQGSQAAVNAYAPEATESIDALARMALRLGDAATAAGAPACAVGAPGG